MRWWRPSDILLAVALISLSAVLYSTQLAIFGDPRNTEFYILQDFAFLPISVLVVTLVLERLLELRDYRQRLEKLRILIGTFFSSVGYGLLDRLGQMDRNLGNYSEGLQAETGWTETDFETLTSCISGTQFAVRATPRNLDDLRAFLHDRTDLMIRLLENPMIQEHEAFTELLRAVFHLIEELEVRDSFDELPQSDLAHLSVDCERVYLRLLGE